MGRTVEVRRRFPKAKVLPADGEMFNWYGSSLLKAPGYFRSLLDGIRSGGLGQ